MTKIESTQEKIKEMLRSGEIVFATISKGQFDKGQGVIFSDGQLRFCVRERIPYNLLHQFLRDSTEFYVEYAKEKEVKTTKDKEIECSKLKEVVEYCLEFHDKFWASKTIAILLDCDFRDAKQEAEKFLGIYKEQPKQKEYFQMAVRTNSGHAWYVCDDLIDRSFKDSTGKELYKNYERKILEHTKVVL